MLIKDASKEAEPPNKEVLTIIHTIKMSFLKEENCKGQNSWSRRCALLRGSTVLYVHNIIIRVGWTHVITHQNCACESAKLDIHHSI